jgi:rare lipoprotein A
MTASWYGKKFDGRPTSSGERYDMYGLTAAHKTLKFGTKLRVTNPDTDESVVVLVNDRGPFIHGRDLDLSYGAAKEIGFVEKGVGKVKIEYVGRDMRYVKRIRYIPPGSSGTVTIQVGSFTDQSRAVRLKQGLEYTYDDVYITSVMLKGQKYYRVRIGEFDDRTDASSVAEKLADEGYSTLMMTRD